MGAVITQSVNLQRRYRDKVKKQLSSQGSSPF